MLPVFFSRWCRRYAAHFAAVGAAFYTTPRVNAALFFSAVGVGVIPPFTAIDAAFKLMLREPVDAFQPLV